MTCHNCGLTKAILIRPKNKIKLCKKCFIYAFESDVHNTIIENNLFLPNENIGVAISGGKDSTVLAHVLNLLNKRHEYGINIYLLSVDEGIKNYRDFSLETVRQNQQEYNLPLRIVSYEEYFGHTMDQIVKKIGRKSNCTYCGVFRRQALENGANELGVTQIVTGHNADDMAETVLMNVLRGDISRLKRCTLIKTQTQGLNLPRSKPFKYIYEKEIVMYAFYNNLNYFSVECCYSPGAYRGHLRLFIKELERKDASLILKIIESGDSFLDKQDKKVLIDVCKLCKHATSAVNLICKSCILLRSLE
ncbi:cytosolic thiouridylase subunit Ctu1 [Conglomerata obtusa]